MSSILPTKQVEKEQPHSNLELIEILSLNLKKKGFYINRVEFKSNLQVYIYFPSIYYKKFKDSFSS